MIISVRTQSNFDKTILKSLQMINDAAYAVKHEIGYTLETMNNHFEKICSDLYVISEMDNPFEGEDDPFLQDHPAFFRVATVREDHIVVFLNEIYGLMFHINTENIPDSPNDNYYSLCVMETILRMISAYEREIMKKTLPDVHPSVFELQREVNARLAVIAILDDMLRGLTEMEKEEAITQ